MPSRWLWSAGDIAEGNTEALWGLCADLHSEYAPNGGDALAAYQPRDAFLPLSTNPGPHMPSSVLAASSSGSAGDLGGGLHGLACVKPSQEASWLQRFESGQEMGGGEAGGESMRQSQTLTGAWGPASGLRRWLQQMGVSIVGIDGAGGGGTDTGGAVSLGSKDYACLDRGLALLDDPLRNGRVVWEVAVHVAVVTLQHREQDAAQREGRKARSRVSNTALFRIPFARPKSVADSRANMVKALDLLRGCGLEVSPTSTHASVLEAILQGDEAALWGLLDAFRAAVTPTPQCAQPAVMTLAESHTRKARKVASARRSESGGGGAAGRVVKGLPYRLRDISLLEVAVMQWMLTLPLLPDSLSALTSVVMQGDSPPPPASATAGQSDMETQQGWGKQTLAALLPELAKGPLLADVAAAATGRPLQPVTRAVKTHKVAFNNCLRLSEQLLHVNELSHERLMPVEDAAAALAAGEHCVMLGLLEDLMRCSFRVPPRKRLLSPKGREIPFLGPYAPPPRSTTSGDGSVVAPFVLEKGPATASWGAWGEDGSRRSAPYTLAVVGCKGAGGGRLAEERTGAEATSVCEAASGISCLSSPRALGRGTAGGSTDAGGRALGPEVKPREAGRSCGSGGQEVDIYRELRRARSLSGGRKGQERGRAKGEQRPETKQANCFRARSVERDRKGRGRMRECQSSDPRPPQYTTSAPPSRTPQPTTPAAGDREEDLGEDEATVVSRLSAVRTWLARLPNGVMTPAWPRGVRVGSASDFARAWADGVALCDLVAALEGLGSGRVVPGSGTGPGVCSRL